jgi:hypothetical protein
LVSGGGDNIEDVLLLLGSLMGGVALLWKKLEIVRCFIGDVLVRPTERFDESDKLRVSEFEVVSCAGYGSVGCDVSCGAARTLTGDGVCGGVEASAAAAAAAADVGVCCCCC